MNNVTMDNITRIINITSGDPSEFFINVNHFAFGGWLFFIILWVLGVILWRRAQLKNDQPLINAMNVSSVITILSLILRAAYVVIDGAQVGLITDFQLWMFPLITVILAGIIRYMSD